jgi:hypothetical protein
MENDTEKGMNKEHQKDEIEPCIICLNTKYTRQRFVKVPQYEDSFDDLFKDNYGL